MHRVLAMVLLLLPMMVFAADQQAVHHELTVKLKPEQGSLKVTDRMRIPRSLRSQGKIRFALNRQLKLDTAETRLRRLDDDKNEQLQVYEAAIGDDGVLSIAYSATWPRREQEDDEGAGVIDGQGVFLSAADHWFADIASAMVSFEMTVALPGGWDAVSQGKRGQHTRNKAHTLVTWRELQPQDDIYLVAGRFTEYSQDADGTASMVFLRQPDEALAATYLAANARYLQLYRELLGPYPYDKFALVENFRQTGFGMPSFTLLGSRVIRLPFIVYSSYPHEILHNWWGNGVFVDYASGNWAEGLTAYLADHLFQEQRGQGAMYRRDNLQKYADFVNAGRDFPLTEFVSRHDQASMAVGYGKTMMMFHMLRLRLGDERFIAALQAFYRSYRFRKAGFADLAAVFGKQSGEDLDGFFRQWTTRAGAPALAVTDVAAEALADGKGFRLRGRLLQRQPAEAWSLQIPMAVQLQDREQFYQHTIDMTAREQTFTIDVPARPLRLLVDPAFEVFRRLHVQEIPAALSQGFGGENILVLLSASESAAWQDAWRQMLAVWQRYMHLALEVRMDEEFEALPAERPVWLLGWDNKHRQRFLQAATRQGIQYQRGQGRIAGTDFNRDDASLVTAIRHPDNDASTLVWLAAHDIAALPGLARKLPRYSKYSYLLFKGEEPVLQKKGQWNADNSPLVAPIPDAEGRILSAGSGVLAPRPPLVPAAAEAGHRHGGGTSNN